MKSRWLTADSTSRRIAGLSNGGYQVIEPDAADAAHAVLHIDGGTLVAPQHANEVDWWLLPPVEFALAQRRRRGSGIRLERPHHTVEMHDARTGEEARCALRPRHVAVELHVDAPRALDALIGEEAEWTAAGRIADLRVGIGLCDALRHDHTVRLRKCDRHQPERLLQPNADDAIRRRRNFGRPAHHRAAERVALAPAQDASDAIARQHLLAIVEVEAVAQR